LHEKLGNNFLDTKVIVNLINLKAKEQGLQPPFPVVSLSKPGGIKEVLGLQAYLAHDAMGDVLATREVLLRLITLVELKK
jgi:DNA polymerase III epsilon subunit-like protein